MKRVLIISPHFPPTNAADMQRVRMSLPYYKSYGWEAEVITVKEKYIDIIQDPLLMESVPQEIIIHRVSAFSKHWTGKFGLGDLALRSMWFYKRKVNQLLKNQRYDLIYFSTTRFPICILGAYWKKKFNVPYVIDMQDPWYSTYYDNKPKNERPKKYWFSNRLHKYLEPKAMNYVDGLISVSAVYLETLKNRYPVLQTKPSKVITFGAFIQDFEIAKKHSKSLKPSYLKKPDTINVVYVGRGGFDMKSSVYILLESFKIGLQENFHLFNNVHFHFIGTSYAPAGQGVPTISPLATNLDLAQYVSEYPDRIGFYQSIANLKNADGLLIIGSDDHAYTASKLFPYILAEKPVLAVINESSSVAEILKQSKAGHIITFNSNIEQAYNILSDYISAVKGKKTYLDWEAFKPYTSSTLTAKQVALFNEVLSVINNIK